MSNSTSSTPCNNAWYVCLEQDWDKCIAREESNDRGSEIRQSIHDADDLTPQDSKSTKKRAKALTNRGQEAHEASAHYREPDRGNHRGNNIEIEKDRHAAGRFGSK